MADTVRLRSVSDPAVVIEGPVGTPFDPREWRPANDAQSILQQNLKSAGRQTNAFSEAGNLARVGAPVGIQMGLTAAAGTAGTALGGPAGGVAGAMLGSGAGEALNQAVGLSDPSMAHIGIAAALPGAMAGAGKVVEKGIQVGARLMPGAAATMHQIARASLDKLSTIFGPSQPSGPLYELVNTFDPKIPLTAFKKTAEGILSKEEIAANGLKLPGVTSTASELAGRVTPTTKQVATGVLDAQGKPITRSVSEGTDAMTFQDIRVNLRRIGDKIRETRITGGEEHGAWKAMRKSMMDDLEAAANTGNEAMPAVQALKQANAAFRREATQEEIADIFTKGGMTARPDIGEGFVQVNLNRIAQALRVGAHADEIKSVLRPEEYKALNAEIARLAQATPNLPPPRGQFAGSAVRVGQVAGGGAAGYLGSKLLGLDPQTGTAIGTLVGAKGADWLSRLVMTDRGRATLQFVIQSSPGGIISPQTMQLLGAAASLAPPVREGVTNLTEFAAGVEGASK